MDTFVGSCEKKRFIVLKNVNKSFRNKGDAIGAENRAVAARGDMGVDYKGFGEV